VSVSVSVSVSMSMSVSVSGSPTAIQCEHSKYLYHDGHAFSMRHAAHMQHSHTVPSHDTHA